MKEYTHILVPYDGSTLSDHALDVAQTLAKTYEAEMTLLYVHDKAKESSIWQSLVRNEASSFLSSQTNVDVAPLPNPPIEEMHPSQTEDEEEVNLENEIFANAKGKIIDDSNVKYRIIEGEPIKEIIKYASQKNADLIIIGSDGQKGFRRLAVDPMTQKIANETKSSIFIVK